MYTHYRYCFLVSYKYMSYIYIITCIYIYIYINAYMYMYIYIYYIYELVAAPRRTKFQRIWPGSQQKQACF